MSIIKTAVVSMIIVCSVTLWGCSTDATETEHVPFVMVTQPNSTHNEQKSYAGDVQARQQTLWHFGLADKLSNVMSMSGIKSKWVKCWLNWM